MPKFPLARPKWSLFLMPLLAAMPCAMPARAQLLPRAEVLPRPSVPSTVTPLSFDDIFAGLHAPLTYKVSDLKGEWRLVRIKARPELEGSAITPVPPTDNKMLTSQRLRDAMGAGAGQYVTQGQTVTAGGELFLVTYAMKLDDDELQAALQADVDKNKRQLPLPPAELGAWLENYGRERTVELTLLNVKMLGEMSDIRLFNAETQAIAIRNLMRLVSAETPAPVAPTATDITPGVTTPVAPTAPVAPTGNGNTTGTPKPPTATGNTPKPPAAKPAVKTPPLAARNAASQRNLHLIGLAMLAYAQDHGGVLPPLHGLGEARKELTFYAGSDAIWARPDNGQKYVPNPMLSNRKVAHISNPDEFVAFYEAAPATDGTRGVVLLNGDTKRLTKTEWPHAKKASKLP